MTDRVGLLTVHRAERADALADALAEVLAVPLADPFATEVVAVPARGVERWLAQRLSHRLGTGSEREDGVCAGISFPSPAQVVDAALDAMSGTDPDRDPWRPARLAWPLLEVIDLAAGEPWCAALGAHLGTADPGDLRRGRRYATARRLAELFVGYAMHRPELLADWTAGGGIGADTDLGWQPELWRRLRTRVGEPDPTQRLAGACTALRTDPDRVPLPARLSLFGPTRLPAAHLAVLVAVAEHREVHLWLPHPSPALWDRIAALPPPVPAAAAAVRPERGRGPAPAAVLARPGRAGAAAAAGHGGAARPAPPPSPTRAPAAPCSAGCSGGCATTGRRPPRSRSPTTTAACRCTPATARTGRSRCSARSWSGCWPTTPRWSRGTSWSCARTWRRSRRWCRPRSGWTATGQGAPMATPGSGCGCGWPTGRCARSTRCWTPWPRCWSWPTARITAAQVLDLLATAPVRRRFRMDADDLDRLRTLTVRSGVRWGLDAHAPRPLPAGRLPAEHLVRRAGPAAARGGHVRGRG